MQRLLSRNYLSTESGKCFWTTMMTSSYRYYRNTLQYLWCTLILLSPSSTFRREQEPELRTQEGCRNISTRCFPNDTIFDWCLFELDFFERSKSLPCRKSRSIEIYLNEIFPTISLLVSLSLSFLRRSNLKMNMTWCNIKGSCHSGVFWSFWRIPFELAFLNGFKVFFVRIRPENETVRSGSSVLWDIFPRRVNIDVSATFH